MSDDAIIVKNHWKELAGKLTAGPAIQIVADSLNDKDKAEFLQMVINTQYHQRWKDELMGTTQTQEGVSNER